ncbi:MAG TPA: hypothetical protein VF426_09385 [Marmoricola sp.]
MRSSTVRARLTGVAALAALALVVAGCGGSGSSDKASASASPSPSVAVPDGVTLTKPGEKLSFGDTADVAYQPNPQRSTVISLKVTKVVRASIKDFSAYVLDKRTKTSTPYYVHVQVQNLGDGNIGGTDVPVWAVNSDDVLIHSSTFTNAFAPCPSPALPKSFGNGAKLTTCLVYLLPDHGTLDAVSFRPRQEVAGIQWTGTVISAKADAKAQKQAQKQAKKKTKKAQP